MKYSWKAAYGRKPVQVYLTEETSDAVMPGLDRGVSSNPHVKMAKSARLEKMG